MIRLASITVALVALLAPEYGPQEKVWGWWKK